MWLFVVLAVCVVRLLWLIQSHRKSPVLENPHQGNQFKIMVVLGSGGHTTEILRLVKPLIESKQKQLKFMLVVANTDHTSVPRIASILGSDFTYDLFRIPRIRHVGDSLLTAIFRLPLTLLAALRILYSTLPDVIITNGPGTCLPVIFASLALEFLAVSPLTVRVFVESFCRVTSISHTGKLVYRFVDSFILQWRPTAEISAKYPKAKYLGVLI